MRALIWLLVLFAVAAGLAVAARYNDGYVLIVANPWRIELSLNFLVVLLVAGFAVLYVLLRLVASTLAMPSQVAAFRARKRHRTRNRRAGQCHAPADSRDVTARRSSARRLPTIAARRRD